ncbi:MAG: helix-turn-helix domain-containing protein [Oscillospiraceae bacterium]|jgi:transcriptional regulator with XRE-family HTH domain|nr:helix-turn-helix domain-containing protein [Oscillospiraceae bacterium]
MNIQISETIRRLRKERGITQEELADIFNVSFQSVSKWERGECFPDITLLPALANFFKVSIDTLFGMQEVRDKTYLPNIYKRAHEHEKNGEHAAAAALLRDALNTFPNHNSLLSELALALSFSDDEGALKEAIACSEHVLANSTNEKLRGTTRANLCFLYSRAGERQKAFDTARTLPHVWESREIIASDLLEGEEQIKALKKAIHVILGVIYEKINAPQNANNKTALISTGPKGCGAEDMRTVLNAISVFL